MRRHGCVDSRRARVVHRAQRYDGIERNERHSDKLGHEPAPSTHCTSISAGVDDSWWMSVEAAVALWSGIAAHSLTLVAFGFDGVIELASAGFKYGALPSKLSVVKNSRNLRSVGLDKSPGHFYLPLPFTSWRAQPGDSGNIKAQSFHSRDCSWPPSPYRRW